jgi:hypothetical protein
MFLVLSIGSALGGGRGEGLAPGSGEVAGKGATQALAV